MKRIAMLFASGLLILSLAVAGCGAQSATDDNAPDTAAKAPDTTASSTGATASGKAPITIGIEAAQTGPLSVLGKQAEAGIRQAAQEWQQKNGQEVKIIIEDDQSTADGAKAAYQRLVAQKPAAIAGITTSPLVAALMDSVKQAQIPTIICLGPNNDPQKHGGWYFQACTEAFENTQLFAAYAAKELGAKKPVLIYSDTPGSREGAMLLKPAFEKAGIPLIATEAYTNDQDMPTAMDKAKADGGDLLVAWTGPVDSVKVSVLAKQKQVSIPLLGNAYFASSDYIKAAGAASEGIYTYSPSFVGQVDETKPFVDAIHASFPAVDVNWAVAHYYDGTMMILNAIQKAGSTDPNKVREAMLATKNYKGIGATYTFDSAGHGMHQMIFGKWQGKKLVDTKILSSN